MAQNHTYITQLSAAKMGEHTKPGWKKKKKKQIKGYCKSELPSRTVSPTWKPYFHNPQCNLQQTHRGLKGMIKTTWVFTWTSDWVSCCRSIATAERPKRFFKRVFSLLCTRTGTICIPYGTQNTSC